MKNHQVIVGQAQMFSLPEPATKDEVITQLELSAGKFQNFIDTKLKINALLEITKSSELEFDW